MPNLEIIISAVTSSAITSGIIVFLGKKFLETWIGRQENRIKLNLEAAVRRREKAAVVAELLAEWACINPNQRKLNSLTWEATLWLPDDEARELNNLLAHQGGTIKQLLVSIKSVISGEPSKLTPDDIVSFNQNLSQFRPEFSPGSTGD